MKVIIHILTAVLVVLICFTSCKTTSKTISNEKKEQIDRDKKGFDEKMKTTEE